jgi:hypothetical protein
MDTRLQPRSRTWRRIAILIGATVATAASAAPAAIALTPPDDYASHVVSCQQEHGFDGVMNPGMHEGRSGWDPEHAC